jgi:hypothetical protein
MILIPTFAGAYTLSHTSIPEFFRKQAPKTLLKEDGVLLFILDSFKRRLNRHIKASKDDPHSNVCCKNTVKAQQF